MKVRAPGKLILSGEHAIVYGKPALAMAVNRYAEVQTSNQALPIISFDFSDFAYQQALKFASLSRLKAKIKNKYHLFLRGEFKIRDVLQKPVELAQFAISLLFEVMHTRPTQGVKIKMQSDIPMGCGMGSSAALIVSVIHAIASHLNLPISPEIFFRLGLEAENTQHGYSSGLDLRVSQQGGCLLMKENTVYTRSFPEIPLHIVNTGSPLSSTGECVSEVATLFRHSQIGEDFAEVTLMMDQALQKSDSHSFKTAIRHNHDLLSDIGVVPEKVQHFASEVHLTGGATKVCGAGSVTGNNAGILLAVTDDLPALTELCSRYNYSLMPVLPEARGVHVV